jgi:protein tyrosine/serine phosphatase
MLKSLREPFHLGRFLRNAAIVVAVVGGGAFLWFEVLRDRFVAKRFAEVTTYVHRSGQLSEHVVDDVLEDHKIARIIDLTEAEYMPPGKIEERRFAAEQGIEIVNYPLVGDGTGDVVHYARAVAALIEAERTKTPVLVHCAAGTHRTGGVVGTFRILYQGWSIEDALEEAELYDWERHETPMSDYLKENLPRVKELLIEWGALPAERASAM